MKKSYAVIGLGRFGSSVALALSEAGVQVLAIDSDAESVKRIAPFVTCAVNIDVCDTDAMKEVGLDDIDGVVVAMGHNLEASAMSIITAKEMGVPYIIAKSNSDEMAKILMKIGADKVVYPEKDAGYNVAKKLLCSNFMEFFEISKDLGVAEITVKKEWIGRTIKELNLRKEYKINIVAIKEGNKVISDIDPDTRLKEDSRLIVIMSEASLKRMM
jgi:trk system potassium uptake protein TrkA